MPHGGADVDSGALNAFFRFPVRLFVSPLPFGVFLLVLPPAALQAQVGEDRVTVWEGEQPGRTETLTVTSDTLQTHDGTDSYCEV